MSLTSNPIDIHVGQRLRNLRLHRRLTQEELGSLVGVSYQQIQKYEAGTNRISASRLYLLGSHLGVGPQYFFDELALEDPAIHPAHMGREISAASRVRQL